MKLNKVACLLVPGLILAVAMSGCRKRPEDPSVIYGSKFGHPDVPSSDTDTSRVRPPRNVTSDTNDRTRPPEPLPNPDDISKFVRNADFFSKDTVHFGFDSSVLKADQKPNLAKVASYLKDNQTYAVQVEGHCDERGTAEYNRSLGERRALAVREELINQGIAPGRIDTISYGFDRPIDTGHNETAWGKNRRGEFILLTPPAKP
jgi:peptidoglycan-associated lipoprotein